MKYARLSTFNALGVAASLLLSAGALNAQNRPQGNFDPEQARQRMMERYRGMLEIKDDGEWKIISERIEKVSALRREAGTSTFGGFGGFRPPGGGTGGDNATQGNGGTRGKIPGGTTGDTAGRTRGGTNGGDTGGRTRGGFTREASPEQDALQMAIEANAPADEIKSKMARLRDARKAGETKLEKAQDDLRQVLSVRQEAIALMAGLLK
jgi:hypothetical protein